MSFNLAIDKDIDWEPKSTNKEPQQDTSSCGSFHLRTELATETFVYIGIEPYLSRALNKILKIMVRASRSPMQWRLLSVNYAYVLKEIE